MLGEEIQGKEAERQRIIDADFKSFINTMTEENTMKCYLSLDTSTNTIMDEFYNGEDKEFLCLVEYFLVKI